MRFVPHRILRAYGLEGLRVDVACVDDCMDAKAEGGVRGRNMIKALAFLNSLTPTLSQGERELTGQ